MTNHLKARDVPEGMLKENFYVYCDKRWEMMNFIAFKPPYKDRKEARKP